MTQLQKSKSKLEFDAIGTGWEIDIYQDISAEKKTDILAKVLARIDAFDRVYSRFREDSLVTAMSKKSGTYELPDDGKLLMEVYKKMYDSTDGKMTPLIGQVLVDAGYDANYSLTQSRKLVRPPSWDEVISYNHPMLTLKKPALLDFGAAGKGYLIDLVGGVLLENGIDRFCIDAGGDMMHKDKQVGVTSEPLKVGLENPEDFKQVIGVIDFANKSLCGSAGSRRKWANFNHIIDPFELSSPKDILATWVIADTTIMADALASALFFVPAAKLVGTYDFKYIILRADFTIEQS